MARTCPRKTAEKAKDTIRGPCGENSFEKMLLSSSIAQGNGRSHLVCRTVTARRANIHGAHRATLEGPFIDVSTKRLRLVWGIMHTSNEICLLAHSNSEFRPLLMMKIDSVFTSIEAAALRQSSRKDTEALL
jgi:hypothetical protein